MKKILSNYTVTMIAASFLVACSVQQNKEDYEPVANKVNTPAHLPQIESSILKQGIKQEQAKILLPATIEADKISRLESKINTQQPTIAPQKHKSRKLQSEERILSSSMMAKVAPYSAVYNRGLHDMQMPVENLDRENYAHLDENSTKLVSEHPVSTFSIDVDTGSYANVRRFLQSGHLPRTDAVRVEELINYFSYNYPQPEDDTPFSVTTEIAPTPWNKNTHLLHIGIKGVNHAQETLPPSNLVFLIDVSGSMRSANKLNLLKTSLKLLAKQLRKQDTLSIVVYAGASGVVLEPIAGNKTAQINRAIDALAAGGSTNGGAGIRLAYSLAKQSFAKDGINRVILATDGDFNVGTVSFNALIELIESNRKTGISLTTLGFGTGNYNDNLMEQIADKGNGNYHYIDTLNEAQKVLVDEMTSTLQTIAKDVKIQIEFNKNSVSEYRLIGYENRSLKREDFNNDNVDAGEIGAGHTVTALYEIVLAGSNGGSIDHLRYQDLNTQIIADQNKQNKKLATELAFLKLRFKAPDADKSKLISIPLYNNKIITDIHKTSDRFRFSAAVAAFGQALKGGKYMQTFSYEDILNLARKARGDDHFGYRGEFIKLVNLAKSLS